MKVVINKCYGGFDISEEAVKLLSAVKNTEVDSYSFKNQRTVPDLVKVVEELGTEKASGKYGKLKVVTIPDDINWTIKEYDGNEWIAESHRTWD